MAHRLLLTLIALLTGLCAQFGLAQASPAPARTVASAALRADAGVHDEAIESRESAPRRERQVGAPGLRSIVAPAANFAAPVPPAARIGIDRARE